LIFVITATKSEAFSMFMILESFVYFTSFSLPSLSTSLNVFSTFSPGRNFFSTSSFVTGVVFGSLTPTVHFWTIVISSKTLIVSPDL